MKHDKVFFRSDRSKVRITVYLNIDYNVYWRTEVEVCQPGKRKWFNTVNTDGFEFRRLDQDGRRNHIMDKHLLFATKQEIYNTKIELIEKIKEII